MTDRNLFWSNVESKIDHTRFIAVVLHLTFSSQCHSICIRMNPVLPVCYPYVSGMLLVCICMYPYVVCTDVLAHEHSVQPGYFTVSDEASLLRRLTFLGVRHAFLSRIPSSFGARTRDEPPKNVSRVWGYSLFPFPQKRLILRLVRLRWGKRTVRLKTGKVWQKAGGVGTG